jgi:hypothetical protein
MWAALDYDPAGRADLSYAVLQGIMVYPKADAQ